ncbi:MAG: GNAT family N-acetyltransferase [Thermoplasmatota archaeon]
MRIEERSPDPKQIREIMEGLSDYFTPKAKKDAQRDLGKGFLGIYDDDNLLGFIIHEIRDAECEILWMAVRRDHRGKGLGSGLLDHLESIMKDRKIGTIKVKTLDDSAGYDPYQKTTRFYENRGFQKIDFIEEIPEWGPGNPCAVYRKKLT